MTTDIFGRMLFNDGEGIEFADLTAIDARGQAILWDQIIAMLPQQLVTGATTVDPSFTDTQTLTSIPYALSLTSTDARPIQGSANNKVKIAAGTLMQAIGTATGVEPALLAVMMPGTDEVTIANGDATNPRVDLIQIAMSYIQDTPTSRDFQDGTTRALTTTTPNKRRRVAYALTVKQGTPAASPTYPTLDAGCVAIAAVVVGATYSGAAGLLDEDTTGAVAVLHDQRVPIGRPDTQLIMPAQMLYDSTIWGLSSARSALIAGTGASGSSAGAVCQSMPQGRLLGIGTLSNTVVTITGPSTIASAILVRLSKLRWSDAGGGPSAAPPVLTSVTLATANSLSGGSAGWRTRFQSFSANLSHLPAAGPVVQANAAGVGAPIWTSGRRCPRDPGPASIPTPFPLETLIAEVFPANTGGSGGLGFGLGPVTFRVAVGL